MSIASKFRNVGIMATSAAVALASLPFNREVRADNVAVAAPSASANLASVNATLSPQFKETILLDAKHYSEQHKALGIVVFKGAKSEGGLTGQDIYRKLADYFGTETPTKDFIKQSAGDYSTVGYFIKGQMYGPYDLKRAVGMAPIIASDFYSAHVVPEAPPKLAQANTTAAVTERPSPEGIN